ncbi:MAG: type 1 glutamine amidotransferase [Flavobacteriales bacterium]
MRIQYLQHVAFEGLGFIEDWALAKGHSLTSTKFYEAHILPDLSSFDWLIIMGGPMGVYDEEKFSWLAAEKALIRSAIDAGKTVVGICLGAQLIAEVLGAKVYPNKFKEIGWFPIQRSANSDLLPDNFTVFHWHGDTFDLPEGAYRLAETAACKNQAFIYKEKVLALQFHLEATPFTLQQMVQQGKDELLTAPYIQTEKQMLEGERYCAAGNKVMAGLLDLLS